MRNEGSSQAVPMISMGERFLGTCVESSESHPVLERLLTNVMGALSELCSVTSAEVRRVDERPRIAFVDACRRG